MNRGDTDKVANVPTKKPSPNSSSVIKPYGIVIPNHYPHLAEQFISSIRATHKQMPDVVVVRDRHDATFGEGIKVIDGIEPFIFARNANIGIQYFASRNVFLCNDDLECVIDDFFPKMAKIASRYPKCGIFSPLVMGGIGNEMQQYYRKDEMWAGKPSEVAVMSTMHFPCVMVMRRMIHRIGLMDESFAGYGWDDIDYCIRAIRAGFDTMITQQLYIKHGDGGEGVHKGKNYSLSFVREDLNNLSVDHFNRKYGTDFVLNDQRV